MQVVKATRELQHQVRHQSDVWGPQDQICDGACRESVEENVRLIVIRPSVSTLDATNGIDAEGRFRCQGIDSGPHSSLNRCRI